MNKIKTFEGFFKNDKVKKAVNNIGMKIYKIIEGEYRTYPKNGFEFSIKDNGDDYTIRTSYYGTQYRKDKSSDLESFMLGVLNGETPDIIHKFNYEYKDKN